MYENYIQLHWQYKKHRRHHRHFARKKYCKNTTAGRFVAPRFVDPAFSEPDVSTWPRLGEEVEVEPLRGSRDGRLLAEARGGGHGSSLQRGAQGAGLPLCRSSSRESFRDGVLGFRTPYTVVNTTPKRIKHRTRASSKNALDSLKSH